VILPTFAEEIITQRKRIEAAMAGGSDSDTRTVVRPENLVVHVKLTTAVGAGSSW
jgi:hypothetical protein